LGEIEAANLSNPDLPTPWNNAEFSVSLLELVTGRGMTGVENEYGEAIK
jgi:hypothetical protein